MGMFDDLRCEYPLPVVGANGLAYQTKDTPAQYLDLYEIRSDGTLWHQEYDIEDHSKLGKWMAENPGKEPSEEQINLMNIGGCMTRVNKRWVQEHLTGEIRFYTSLGQKHTGWIEWSADFVEGKLNQLHLIQDKPADTVGATPIFDEELK